MNLLFFLLLIFTTAGEQNACRTPYPDAEINELIEATERLLNFHSLKCNFTPLEDSPEQTKEYEFIYQNGNIYMSSIIDSYKPQKTTDSSQPKNLLELISYKINQSQQQTIAEQNPIVLHTYYLYNGEESGRFIKIYGNNDIIIEPAMKVYDGGMLLTSWEPRINMGFVGEYFTYWGTKYKLHISEFLKKEGPFFLTEKEGFITLWHEIDFDEYLPEEERYGAKLSLEIWFDNKKRIHKIRKGNFWSRSMGLEKVKNIIGEECSCDYPDDIFLEVWFDEYKEFENGFYLPLKATLDSIKPDEKDTRYKELWEKNNKQRDLFFIIKSSTFNKKRIKNTHGVIIKESSVKINEPIPEDTFIAPEPNITQEDSPRETDSSYFEKLKLITFISICVLLTLLAMFITRKYFGWGL